MAAIITSPNAPAALGPYSHAVLAGDTLYTSGQIGLIPETGVLAGDTIEAQATQVFSNLRPGGQAAGWRKDRNGSRGNQVNGLAAFRQTMRLEKLAEHPSVFSFLKTA